MAYCFLHLRASNGTMAARHSMDAEGSGTVTVMEEIAIEFEPSPSASLPESPQPTSTAGKGSDADVPGIEPLLVSEVPPRSVKVAT